MVEIIEDLFIPLAIHNNKKGEDARVLELFNEPSWNNPVVRVIDSKSDNIVPRLSGNYSALGLLKTLEHALKTKGQTPPEYFQLLVAELEAQNNPHIKDAYYEMYCFWSGEVHLAQAPGVIATESGFMNGREVVKVRYDSQLNSHKALTKHAHQAQCSPIAHHKSYAISTKDTKYQLKNSRYAALPLTSLQQLHINTALGTQQQPQRYLSPRQIKQLAN